MITPTLAYLERVLANSSFDSATWTKTNATVTPNTTAAPDGTVTADTLNDADAVNSGTIAESFAIPADVLTRLCSIYFKAGTAAVCSIRVAMTGGVGANIGIAFNPTTGLFTRCDSIAGAPTQVGVTTLPNGWFRVTFPYTNNNNTNVAIEVRPAYAAALAGSGLGVTTVLDATRTGTVIAWLASSKDSFTATYPPMGKNLAPELDATREDSITSSGIKQSITERVDSFQDFNFGYVPQSDIAFWSTMMANLLAGGVLTYFPDSTDLSTSTDYTTDDLVWQPKRVAFGHAGFKIRLRQVV